MTRIQTALIGMCGSANTDPHEKRKRKKDGTMKANMVVLTAREDNNEYIVAWYLEDGEKLEYNVSGETFLRIEKSYKGWQQINLYTEVAIL